MTEELNFEAYLVISRKKFEIQLLDKKNLKNIILDSLAGTFQVISNETFIIRKFSKTTNWKLHTQFIGYISIQYLFETMIY